MFLLLNALMVSRYIASLLSVLPPRHLRIVSMAPVPVGLNKSRNAAVVGIVAACQGRKHNPQVPPISDASCNRLVAVNDSFLGQYRTALQAPERSACSAAHSASLSCRGFKITVLSRLIPRLVKAGGYGIWGGCIQI